MLTKYTNVSYVKTVVADDGSTSGTSKKYGLFSVNNSENYFLSVYVLGNNTNKQYSITFGLTTEQNANATKLIYSMTALNCSVTNSSADKRVYVTNYPLYLVAKSDNKLIFMSTTGNGSNSFYFDIDIYSEKAIFIYRSSVMYALYDGIVTDSYQVQYTNLTISKTGVCMTENIVFNKDTEIAICKNLKIILLAVSDYQGIFDCEVDGVNYVRVGNILISM